MISCHTCRLKGVYVCVCVCVCVWERERMRKLWFFLNSVRLTNYLPFIPMTLHITRPDYSSHVIKQEIERRPHPFSTSSHAESLVHMRWKWQNSDRTYYLQNLFSCLGNSSSGVFFQVWMGKFFSTLIRNVNSIRRKESIKSQTVATQKTVFLKHDEVETLKLGFPYF